MRKTAVIKSFKVSQTPRFSGLDLLIATFTHSSHMASKEIRTGLTTPGQGALVSCPSNAAHTEHTADI